MLIPELIAGDRITPEVRSGASGLVQIPALHTVIGSGIAPERINKLL